MRVNFDFKRLFGNWFTVFCGISVAIAVFFLASSFTRRSDSEVLSKRVNLVIRDIGHNLLLQAGDSTSRVLPVSEISKGVFLLEFEKQFTFKPDTLVALTRRLIAKTNLSSDYTVTVHECKRPDIVYGFQISVPANDIKPCSGRIQPQGCYSIQIAFADLNTSSERYSSLSISVTAVLIVCVVMLLFDRLKKNEVKLAHVATAAVAENGNDRSHVGKFIFVPQNQCLLFGSEVVNLTEKESRILEVLHRNFGELTLRENLIDEIWTNEGVITGRSLDMFVSKLRKKLSADPAVRITNVHGKGYKLEVAIDKIE